MLLFREPDSIRGQLIAMSADDDAQTDIVAASANHGRRSGLVAIYLSFREGEGWR